MMCFMIGGLFYSFPKINGTAFTSEEFPWRVLEKAGVATCPGNFFGLVGDNYSRFCYANSAT
jgi:aspartate/methionine/tyrosine aminotransferase